MRTEAAFCSECIHKSVELSQQRREFAQLLAAIIESNGGSLKAYDRQRLAYASHDYPVIEAIEDKDNRCIEYRVVKRTPPGSAEEGKTGQDTTDVLSRLTFPSNLP